MATDVFKKYGTAKSYKAPTESEVLQARRWVIGNRIMWGTLVVVLGGWWLSTWTVEMLVILGLIVLAAVILSLIITVSSKASDQFTVLDKATKMGVKEDD